MEPTGAAEARHEGRHPAHEDIAATLRSWHTTSVPEAGIRVTETWYGYLSNADGDEWPRVLLTIDRPDDVPAALASVRSSWDAPEYVVWVTDRARRSRLDPELRVAGCEPVKATTHLTLVGELHARPGPDALVVDDAGKFRLREWAEVKIKSFEDTEGDPTATQLECELAVRARGTALETLALVRLGKEAVGVLGYYAGADQLVFNLGTRVPYRRQGIAQAVLARWAAEGRAEGCRSLTINADDPGRPAELYRRLGFTDEVYWHMRYRLGTRERRARVDGAAAAST
jgi:GNAT superfamily N-acetyltransferase